MHGETVKNVSLVLTGRNFLSSSLYFITCIVFVMSATSI